MAVLYVLCVAGSPVLAESLESCHGRLADQDQDSQSNIPTSHPQTLHTYTVRTELNVRELTCEELLQYLKILCDQKVHTTIDILEKGVLSIQEALNITNVSNYQCSFSAVSEYTYFFSRASHISINTANAC